MANTYPQRERPGVEIAQEFRTTAPVIQTPALAACIIGPAFEVIEAVQDDGSLNPDASLNLPAIIPFAWVSSPFQYAAVGALSLSLEVDNAPAASVTISGASSTARTVDQVAADIRAAAIPGLAVRVETSGSQKRVVAYTVATGDFASLRVGTSTAAGLVTAFGIRLGQLAVGATGYHNHVDLAVGTTNYPNPRGNLAELDIDYDTVRVFVNNGAGSFKEALRTEALLTGGVSAVSVADDGDGDNLSPYISVASANFKLAAAVLTGTVDLSALDYTSGGPFNPAIHFLFTLNSGSQTDVTLSTSVANAAGVVTAINTAVGATVASLGASNHLVLTSQVTGYTSKVEIGPTAGNGAAAVLGFTAGAVAIGSPGIAKATGTVDITGISYSASVHNRLLRMSIDGLPFQELVFPTSVTNASGLVAAIVALWGSGAARLTNGNRLELNSRLTYGGLESVVRIDKDRTDATLLTALGLTTSGAPFQTLSYVRGNPFPVTVGDEIWADGSRLGTVTEIPASYTNRLRLNLEKSLSWTASTWFILAKGLSNAPQTSTRPGSTLFVDDNSGSVKVDQSLFYDLAGRPTDVGPMLAYLGYKALRLDVTASAANAALQRAGSTTDIEALFSPIDTQNPFGLAMYWAKLASGTYEVTGIGVDEVTDTALQGTADAYERAYTYLESKDVYVLAPLTHDLLVGQIGQVHVNAMSLPESGQERVLLMNPSRPTRRTSTVVASGATANVSGPPTNEVNTQIADLPLLLAAAGVPGPTFTEANGVYIEFEDDTNKYLVESVSGGIVTVATGPLETNSPFFDNAGADVFTSVIVDRPFSVQVLGATIANLTEEAEAYSDLGRMFADRRVMVTAPDRFVATIDALDTVVDGYYANAVLAGVISAKIASAPLTESILPVLKSAVGSNDRYGETQLKIIDGGGVWMFYNDGAAIKTRHQLTTDTTSLYKSEFSVTNALDYGAKVMRLALKIFIGTTNLTQNVQDSVSMLMEAVGRFLVGNGSDGIFKSFSIASLKMIADRPDGLEVVADVGVFSPTNKIRVTFVI